MVVSRYDGGRDHHKPPIRVEAIGTALHGRPSWDQFDDLSTMANRDAAHHLWRRTDLKPRDIDIVQLYGGFSSALSWLEALGSAVIA